jgi:hypothetical protein
MTTTDPRTGSAAHRGEWPSSMIADFLDAPTPPS